MIVEEKEKLATQPRLKCVAEQIGALATILRFKKAGARLVGKNERADIFRAVGLRDTCVGDLVSEYFIPVTAVAGCMALWENGV